MQECRTFFFFRKIILIPLLGCGAASLLCLFVCVCELGELICSICTWFLLFWCRYRVPLWIASDLIVLCSLLFVGLFARTHARIWVHVFFCAFTQAHRWHGAHSWHWVHMISLIYTWKQQTKKCINVSANWAGRRPQGSIQHVLMSFSNTACKGKTLLKKILLSQT